MEKVATQIDNIKEKLTSDEYKNIMESLKEVYDQNKKVKFEVIFSTVYYEVERLDVYMKPQLRRIVLTQPSFPHIFHTHEGDHYRIAHKFFQNGLTNENRQIFENILFVDSKDDKYEDYDSPKAFICYDEKDFVYVRFLEGDMDDPDLGDDSSDDSE